jgi:TonB family protein
MKHPFIQVGLLCLFTLATACEKKDTPAGERATQTKSPASNTPSSKAQKPDVPTAIKDGQEAVSTELRSPKSIAEGIERAQALDKWVTANNGDVKAKKARLLSAQIKIQCVAAAVGLNTPPAIKALGSSGSEAALLTQAVDSLSQNKDTDSGPWLMAANAMLASVSSAKGIAMDRKASLELATGDSDAGQALRTFWLERLEKALKALHSSNLSTRVSGLAINAGNLLCPACDDARHPTPDMVTAALLMAKNKGGFICDLAYNPSEKVTPASQITALSRCGTDLAISPVAETTVYWGANLLAAGTLVMAKDLVQPAIPETGPLASALKKRSAAVQKLLSKAVVLPTPQITGRLPKNGERTELTNPASLEGLGFEGQTSSAPSLTVFQVGPAAVSGFVRPTVQLKDGAVRSVSLDADSPAEDVPFDALKTATADAETGSISAIKVLAERKKDSAKDIDALPKTAQPDTTDLLVDALAPSWAVTKTIDTLKDTGFAHFRFLRTAIHGQALPLVVREAEPELITRLAVGYERPVIAHVSRKNVDIWLPAKPTGTATKSKKVSEPKGVVMGYKGKKLVRLRVSIPQGMGHGLNGSALNQIAEATKFVFAKSGAGPLLLVTTTDDALAADVLRVSRIFQESPGKTLEGDQAIWPGSQCAKTNVANGGKAKCPSGVSVAFSKAKTPSSLGVTSEPTEAKKKEAKPVEKPKTGFCDRKSIGSKMKRRTAAFRFCYEKALRMQKGLAGRVKVRFTIGANGSLIGSPSVVSASLKNAGVHKCLLKNVSRVKFDPPKGGTCTVSWPFNFKSGD